MKKIGKIKKIIALLVSAVLTLGLTACGSSSSGGDEAQTLDRILEEGELTVVLNIGNAPWTYQDEESVQTIFFLHRETMEENYSLDKIMTKILYQEDERKETRENEDREIQKKEVQNRRNLWEKEEVRYDTREHDWIAEQEMGSLIMEETENLWTPVRRFLRKHKKPRWGEWDDLHIEEEEL